MKAELKRELGHEFRSHVLRQLMPWQDLNHDRIFKAVEEYKLALAIEFDSHLDNTGTWTEPKHSAAMSLILERWKLGGYEQEVFLQLTYGLRDDVKNMVREYQDKVKAVKS